MNTTDMYNVQVASNNTDRETSALRRKALKRWGVLSIILLCLSLSLIIIAVWQTTDVYDRTSALFVVLPSGILTAVASGISLISVWLGYKDIGIFKCCTVGFCTIGVLSMAFILCTLVFGGVIPLLTPLYGMVARSVIILCLCILLIGLITAAIQFGLCVIRAGNQQATGYQVQTECQPVANRYIYQQEQGSSMAIPQGQDLTATSFSHGQDFASHKDTIPGASNI